MGEIPKTCLNCEYRIQRHKTTTEYDKCRHPEHHDGYIDGIHDWKHQYRGKRGLIPICPHRLVLTTVKNTWLWLRMYRKGIEKEQIPLEDEQKAVVKGNWLIMKIAYTADWFIKRYDKKMEQRRLAYNIRQAVDSYISLE